MHPLPHWSPGRLDQSDALSIHLLGFLRVILTLTTVAELTRESPTYTQIFHFFFSLVKLFKPFPLDIMADKEDRKKDQEEENHSEEDMEEEEDHSSTHSSIQPAIPRIEFGSWATKDKTPQTITDENMVGDKFHMTITHRFGSNSSLWEHVYTPGPAERSAVSPAVGRKQHSACTGSRERRAGCGRVDPIVITLTQRPAVGMSARLGPRSIVKLIRSTAVL